MNKQGETTVLVTSLYTFAIWDFTLVDTLLYI